VGSGDSDANDEAFGVFELAGVRLSGGIGVKEETSVPHSRLAYIHRSTLLLGSFCRLFEE
jgi:hypothetical protein